MNYLLKWQLGLSAAVVGAFHILLSLKQLTRFKTEQTKGYIIS